MIYEVKPLEAGQDMKELEAAIRSIEIDGLVWGEEFKVLDVAFGIQKIVCQCSELRLGRGCCRVFAPRRALPPLQLSRTRRSASRTLRRSSSPSLS